MFSYDECPAEPNTIDIDKATPDDELDLSLAFTKIVRAFETLSPLAKAQMLQKANRGALSTLIENPSYVILRSRDVTGVTGFVISKFQNVSAVKSIMLVWGGIRPDWRGKELIPGRTLSDLLLSRAQSLLSDEFHCIQCVTSPDEHHAKRLLQRNNFIEAKTVVNSDNGNLQLHWQYYKPITDAQRKHLS